MWAPCEMDVKSFQDKLKVLRAELECLRHDSVALREHDLKAVQKVQTDRQKSCGSIARERREFCA